MHPCHPCPCVQLDTPPCSVPSEPPSSPGQGGKGDMNRHSDRGMSSQDRWTQRWLHVKLDTWKAPWMAGQW